MFCGVSKCEGAFGCMRCGAVGEGRGSFFCFCGVYVGVCRCWEVYVTGLDVV